MSDFTAEELELLLREKEELVEALTERLEQTAEQLDRLQRVNGDRGRWMSGGVPAELVEQQKELCGDLERAVRQWEEMNCGSALGRIEMQLEELRDLVARRPSGRRDEPVRHQAAFERAAERAAVERADEPAPSGQSAWEAMKAGILAGDSHAGTPQVAPTPGAGTPAHDPGPDPFDGTPLEPPAEVDFDTADRAALREAVAVRDAFITEVLRRLRSAEVRTRPTDDWRRLEATPDEFKAKLESLERRLEQTLRLSEVELSLERARLGREAVRLRQLEENAQKAMNRLGLAADEPADDDPGVSANGRWMRMLGLKREQ